MMRPDGKVEKVYLYPQASRKRPANSPSELQL